MYIMLSGVTNRGGEPPPGKLNVKTGPPLADIVIFDILLFFSRLFFCVFSGCFCFLAGIDIHDIRIHKHFIAFFLSVGYWPPYCGQWALFS